MTEAGLLASLEALAGNYRWVWHEATRRVFRAVDPALWDSTGDPFAVVRSASPERLSQLTADRLFRQQLQAAEDDLAGYLAGEWTVVQVWRARVGRVDLYLLDTDVPENPPHLRGITDRLYGEDAEHRLRQEIVLGIGGVRALRALGLAPAVFHANEGHAGFMGLERIRTLVGDGHPLDHAVRVVRAGTVFTTHTALPAGFDRFDRALVDKYFSGWAHECGVGVDWMMALGPFPGAPPDEPFNIAVLCARLY